MLNYCSSNLFSSVNKIGLSDADYWDTKPLNIWKVSPSNQFLAWLETLKNEGSK